MWPLAGTTEFGPALRASLESGTTRTAFVTLHLWRMRRSAALFLRSAEIGAPLRSLWGLRRSESQRSAIARGGELPLGSAIPARGELRATLRAAVVVAHRGLNLRTPAVGLEAWTALGGGAGLALLRTAWTGRESGASGTASHFGSGPPIVAFAESLGHRRLETAALLAVWTDEIGLASPAGTRLAELIVAPRTGTGAGAATAFRRTSAAKVGSRTTVVGSDVALAFGPAVRFAGFAAWTIGTRFLAIALVAADVFAWWLILPWFGAALAPGWLFTPGPLRFALAAFLGLFPAGAAAFGLFLAGRAPRGGGERGGEQECAGSFHGDGSIISIVRFVVEPPVELLRTSHPRIVVFKASDGTDVKFAFAVADKIVKPV